MDATPLTLGQEFSAYALQLDFGFTCTKKYPSTLKPISTWWYRCRYRFEHTKGYDVKVADYIAKFTGLPFVTAENKFEALAAHDAIVETHGAIKH